MWFIIGLIIVLIVLVLFNRSGEIEETQIKDYNKTKGINSHYGEYLHGSVNEYKDSIFHPPIEK